MTRRSTVVREIDPAEARALLSSGAHLLDVREEDEWREARIPGATHVPLSTLAQRWRDLPAHGTLILQCHSGARSYQAAEFLLMQGRADVVSLAGGIIKWARAGLPIVKE